MENEGNNLNITVDHIKEIMKDSGESMSRFAKRIGLSKATVHGWMHGKVGSMKTTSICTIAKTYNVSTEWLMGWSDIKIPEDKNHESMRNTINDEMKHCSMKELDSIQKFYENFIKKDKK